MLSAISVSNYQSLHNVQLELSAFTVIVGPSSSGKSALTRALKTLTSNQRGAAFITHGQKQTTIAAVTDRGIVTLKRGKEDSYTLDIEEEQKTYTKLAGGVPEEVSEFLGIRSSSAINYANQFDMPYLLTASPAEVARTLGELTNVSVIFEAAREANRRRLSAAASLKMRQRDYEVATENLDRFRSLKSDTAALGEIDKKYQEAVELKQSVEQLNKILDVLVSPLAAPIAVPNTDQLESLAAKKGRLNELIEAIAYATEVLDATDQMDTFYAVELSDAQYGWTEAIQALGQCPTCGQSTKEISHGSH